MKRNVVLVLDADADTARAVASAATTRNCDLRFVQTSKEFFHFCRENFENVIAIILEIDPGMHGMAILEASDVCENTPPIIVVSALERTPPGPGRATAWRDSLPGKTSKLYAVARALDQAMESAADPPASVGQVPNCTCTLADGASFNNSPQQIRQTKLWNT